VSSLKKEINKDSKRFFFFFFFFGGGGVGVLRSRLTTFYRFYKELKSVLEFWALDMQPTFFFFILIFKLVHILMCMHTLMILTFIHLMHFLPNKKVCYFYFIYIYICFVFFFVAFCQSQRIFPHCHLMSSACCFVTLHERH